MCTFPFNNSGKLIHPSRMRKDSEELSNQVLFYLPRGTEQQKRILLRCLFFDFVYKNVFEFEEVLTDIFFAAKTCYFAIIALKNFEKKGF